jgi:dipeptidyl aminopeptidase/acylaminoacyl peptidase
MVAARDWLVQQGIARPDQILLTGWSYGGYLTLQALGKRPDLWAGGMAGIAIADWSLQYEDSADALKGVMVAFFGGTPEEKPDQYAASSPITYPDHLHGERQRAGAHHPGPQRHTDAGAPGRGV